MAAMTANAIREALEPCPFCGGPAHSTPEVGELAALVMCSENDCCTISGATLQAATAAWNRRARTAYEALSPVAVEEAARGDCANCDGEGWSYSDLEGRTEECHRCSGTGKEDAAPPQIGNAGAGPVGEAVAWRDMTSAPKDGAIIDLWHEELGRQADCYWGKAQHSCGEAGQHCDSDWHREPEGWVHSSFNSVLYDADSFTHWMPSPAGPDAARTVEEPGEVERLTRERDVARECHSYALKLAKTAEAALAETRERLEKAEEALRAAIRGDLDWPRTIRAALTGDA